MRVLEVNVDDKGYGGVFAFVINVIKYIDHDMFSIDIAAFEPFENEDHKNIIRYYGGEVYSCLGQGNFLIKHLQICIKFYQLLKKHKYKTIHIHSDVAYKLMIYGIVGKLAGVPNILVHSHSSGVEGRLRWLKKLLQAVSKPVLSQFYFTKLACSNLARDWMYTEKHINNVYIIKNGINLERFVFNPQKREEMRKKLYIKASDKVIGTVARFSFSKYPEKLLSIFKKLLERDADFLLLWVGTGPLLEKIKKQSKKYKIDDRIIFYGNTDCVEDIYQVMDMFVLTSRFEGLGIVAIEAQANGMQCLCSSGVPNEAAVSKLFHKIPLESSEDVWIYNIVKYISNNKINSIKEIKKHGYDINRVSNLLASLYKCDK